MKYLWVCVVTLSLAQHSRVGGAGGKGNEDVGVTAIEEDLVALVGEGGEEVVAEYEEPLVTLDAGEDFDFDFGNEDDVLEDFDECSRISPKEIFHTELHPRLLGVLDEMSQFVESVLSRIESALVILIPTVKESPIGEIKVESLFPEVRQFVYGMMRDVYDLVRLSWRDLIRTHVTLRHDAKAQLEALRRVKDAQLQGNEKLRSCLMELSITLKAIVLNSIYSVQDTLKLPQETGNDQVALAISRKVPKIAPNFLGTLMIKMMEKGEDPDNYHKILTDTLRSITGPVEQMYQELEGLLLLEAEGESVDLETYWRAMLVECHLRLGQDPIFESDFEFIFENEEYLTSLVLGLIAAF